MSRVASHLSALAALAVIVSLLTGCATSSDREVGLARVAARVPTSQVLPVAAPPTAASPPAPAAVPRPPARADLATVVRVAFVGDSVAWSTAQALSGPAIEHNVEVVNAGFWGCGVVVGLPFRYFGKQYDSLPQGCDRWPEQWRRALEPQPPDLTVIVVGRWELMDRVHDGGWAHVGAPSFDVHLASQFDHAIAVAKEASSQVAVATAPAFRRGSRPDGGTWPEDEPERLQRVNSLLREAAARNGVAVVEFGQLVSPAGVASNTVDGVRVRTDGVHIAASAGAWLAPRLLPELRALAGS